MITITTVLKTGKYYNSVWVDKMKASLERHLTMPFRFLPLTDCDHLYETVYLKEENPGYWNKIELFRPELFDFPTLYIDLDNVIIGDLSPMIRTMMEHQQFLMYRSRTTKVQPLPAATSCLMYWPRSPTYLWNIWNSIDDKNYWYKKYSSGRQGDQAFIRDNLKSFDFIQDVYTNASNSIKFVQGTEPDLADTSMLIFAGNRKPHTSTWASVKENWHDL